MCSQNLFMAEHNMKPTKHHLQLPLLYYVSLLEFIELFHAIKNRNYLRYGLKSVLF